VVHLGQARRADTRPASAIAAQDFATVTSLHRGVHADPDEVTALVASRSAHVSDPDRRQWKANAEGKQRHAGDHGARRATSSGHQSGYYALLEARLRRAAAQ
jgi:hypothetical protein